MSWECNEPSKLKDPREAMGSGPPLLASRDENLWDWTAGWIVPLESEKIYAVLKHVLNFSETDYDRLSSNALKFARTNSWPTFANNPSPDV